MKKLLSTLLFWGAISVAGASGDVDIPSYQVYEFDTVRFAPNDTKPTLYDIKLVAKAAALWIEGADYNYQWLTIVPYDGVKTVTLERVRGNPFVTDTESWLGRQLAKAGDLRGWFTISYTDRKGVDRQTILLAPVNQEGRLADVLEAQGISVTVKGERQGEPEPDAARGPEIRQLQTSEPVPEVAPPNVKSASPPGPGSAAVPVRLIDLMTVSEFRAAGLIKLTDSELAAFDAWMNQYLKGVRQ